MQVEKLGVKLVSDLCRRRKQLLVQVIGRFDKWGFQKPGFYYISPKTNVCCWYSFVVSVSLAVPEPRLKSFHRRFVDDRELILSLPPRALYFRVNTVVIDWSRMRSLQTAILRGAQHNTNIRFGIMYTISSKFPNIYWQNFQYAVKSAISVSKEIQYLASSCKICNFL